MVKNYSKTNDTDMKRKYDKPQILLVQSFPVSDFMEQAFVATSGVNNTVMETKDFDSSSSSLWDDDEE